MGLTFNSVDLSSAAGLVTPGQQGIHDLADIVIAQTYVPGYALPNETVLRDGTIKMSLPSVMASDLSHADLLSKLHTLKTYVSPRLGWKYLVTSALTGKRTLARFEGFPVNIDALPYDQTDVQFTLTAIRAPWWEDATAQTDASISSGDIITNSGDLECYPVWTLTSTDANAGGVTLTCNGRTFTWEDAFPATDVIVMTTELPTVTYEGTESYAGIADDCEFPTFGAGNNTVTFTGDMTVAASWHRRFE